MFDLQWELAIVGRLCLALLLGAIIGMERESVNQSAGFRTHVLVAVGACLMMIISISMPFIHFPATHGFMTANGDPGRIAAQVVSGIGFLGAGAIMRSGMSIKGLTTAASLWAMAGIGLAIGAGLFIAGLTGTFLIYIALRYFSKLEDYTRLHRQIINIVLILADQSASLRAVFAVFDSMNIIIKNTKVSTNEHECDVLQVELLAKIPLDTDLVLLVEKLKALPEVFQAEMT